MNKGMALFKRLQGGTGSVAQQQGEDDDENMHPGVIADLMRQGRVVTPQQMAILYQEKVAEGEARQRNLTNQQDFHRPAAVGNGYAGGTADASDKRTASEDSVARYLWDRIWRAKTGTIAPTDILSPNPSDPYSVLAQKGMTNVMQTTGNNPGMKLFMGKIKGVRPKLLVPHPSRARLPNAAQLDESVQTPLGIQKGSSGVLSTKQRKAMPKSSFAIPSKSPGSGSYPINDPSHARNALSRVSQFGSPAQKSQVRAAVHRRYPNIGKK